MVREAFITITLMVPMNWFAFAISYSVFWWLVLFMVLPFGVKVPETRDTVEYAAAPAVHGLKKKFLMTTLLAFIPTAVLQCGIAFGWFDGVL